MKKYTLLQDLPLLRDGKTRLNPVHLYATFLQYRLIRHFFIMLKELSINMGLSPLMVMSMLPLVLLSTREYLSGTILFIWILFISITRRNTMDWPGLLISRKKSINP